MWWGAQASKQAVRPLVGAICALPVVEHQRRSLVHNEGWFGWGKKKQEDVMMFHIGTNNWQRQGEFAPGSGILHASFHQTFNAMPGVKCYSIYPSSKQQDPVAEPDYDPTFKIFKLSHDIPICESVSPNSSYRWHSMNEEEFTAYRKRPEGNKKLKHFNFVHGTALKMYIKEKGGDPEYPMRFLSKVHEHGVFDGSVMTSGIF